MPKQELYDITVQVIHETDKAWLVTEDGEKKIWIPKSVGEMSEPKVANTCVLTAPEWILKDKGLL